MRYFTLTLLAGALLATAACQSGMDMASRYAPTVDPAKIDSAKYEADLQVCRTLAATSTRPASCAGSSTRAWWARSPEGWLGKESAS